MQISEPLVSIIIVNWNGKQDLIECVESLKCSNYSNLEVIVVDNDSSDGSIDAMSEYRDIILIKNQENSGFTGGNNVGVKYANGEYVYLLNNDAIIEPDSITNLIGVMEKDASIGGCGSKILFGHDHDLINCAGHMVDNVGFLWAKGYMEIDCGQYDDREEVFMCSACSLMIRKDFVDKYGMFDDELFMYGDELELAFKIWGAGYKIVYEPSSVVFHKQSKGSSDVFIAVTTPFKQYYSNRNRAKIVFKYYPKFYLIMNIPYIILSLFYWDFYLLRQSGLNLFLKSIFTQIRSTLQGILERKDATQYDQDNWICFVKPHTITDFLSFATSHKKLYHGLNKRL